MQRLAAGEIRQLDPDAPREIRPLVAELNHGYSACSCYPREIGAGVGGAGAGCQRQKLGEISGATVMVFDALAKEQ